LCGAEEPKIINVKFQLHQKCRFEEQFMVVGNDPMFGSWNPAKAIPMSWSEGHVWTAEMVSLIVTIIKIFSNYGNFCVTKRFGYYCHI